MWRRLRFLGVQSVDLFEISITWIAFQVCHKQNN